MKSFVVRLSLLLAMTAVHGCADQAGISGPMPGSAAFAIADASHGFAPGFYWRAPIVKQNISVGEFDADAEPVVEICALVDDECSALVARFTTLGNGAEAVRVEGGEAYIVNWHTGRSNLTAGSTYRISVLVDEVLLGYADARALANAKDARSIDETEFIGLVVGRTLPIKFRIETVAPAGISVDPSEATLAPGETQQLSASVTDAGGSSLRMAVSWSSSNPDVASVAADGLVTAIAGGETTITATAGSMSGNALVTVVAPAALGPSIAAGGSHSCAVSATGAAFCWGAGSFGRLGNGGTADTPSPSPVSGGLSFSAVAPGNFHSCAVSTSNLAYCWGAGTAGRLGNGASVHSSVPVAVAGGLSFATVSAGSNATCGVTTAGLGYCWGLGGAGELGDGTISFAEQPVAVAGGLVFASVSAGTAHVCAVTTSAQAYCWGNGGIGRLGDGMFTSSAVPVAVSGGIPFASLSAGDAHTCGLSTGGAAHCWGAGGSGQLGQGAAATSAVPVPVSGGLQFVSVSVGNVHSCALTPAGAAFCWGNGGGGRLGDGTGASSLVPVAVAGGLTFASVDAGGSHTCGVTTDARLFCWGTGMSGQLGNGLISNQLVPVEVPIFP